VKIAESKGAIGVILYSDPQNYAADGRNFVYANSVWMPGMAVQSGSLFLGQGDPLTPNYPALGN
jgi:N-acetylated-alpha-linked acidic dipeptidase